MDVSPEEEGYGDAVGRVCGRKAVFEVVVAQSYKIERCLAEKRLYSEDYSLNLVTAGARAWDSGSGVAGGSGR